MCAFGIQSLHQVPKAPGDLTVGWAEALIQRG